MIYPILNLIKTAAINHPLVNMSSIGLIEEYDNKPNIKYPYVNIDIVNSSITNGSKKYTIRLYVIDKQKDRLVAWNKCELIIDNLLKNNLMIEKYFVNYFTNDYLDYVDGCYVDVEYEINEKVECNINDFISGNFLTLESGAYILNEDGSFIKLEKEVEENLIYFGNTNVIPLTNDDIKLLSNMVFENSTDNIKLNTGNINKIFVIAIPVGKEIDSVFDENAMYADITRTYIKSTIMVEDYIGNLINYNVYIMQNAIPYTRNHIHSINIINI